MKKLAIVKIMQFLVYILPAALFLSYFPVISLGVGETMNFELSVPLLWLIVFDVVAVIGVFRLKKTRMIAGKWYYYLFPFFVTLSVFWSSNVVRGVLTLGVMWAVIVAVVAFVIFRKEILDGEFKRKFWKWFFGAALVACVWCFAQCILDLAGVTREYSLMCLGCTYRSFGFPHPNGFAIEPQFMGNLLLAPTIICVWLLVNKTKLFSSVSRGALRAPVALRLYSSKSLVLLTFIFTATLFLTFSRGAIYAFGVGLIFMSCYLITKANKRMVVAKRVGMAWFVVVFSFLFTLNLQGVMAEISSTDEGYVDGISRVVSQLSLGAINIKINESDEVVENSVENFSEEAVFDGYVPESTDVRLKLTSVALELWRSDVRVMLFGVGIGGAGQALYEAGLIDSPKEIVQNEYTSLLLEVGAVGIMLVIITLVGVLRWMWRLSGFSMVIPLVVAYGVSLCFFSGLPNALHIYLLPIVLCLVCGKDKKALA
ncbi:O-antigen ligase family protein [Candidatus Saccharibacteria bacterium]|nr:O-antigen ligase family protein [Candidatus Saccharibacteria bacterium]